MDIKEYQKNYRESHKSKRLIYMKEYNEENKTEIKKKKHEYYQKNKKHIIEKCKEYYLENREVKLKFQKEYSNLHKEELREWSKEYNIINKKELNDISKNYYQEHKEKMNQQMREYSNLHRNEINEYRRNKSKNNVNFKISCYLRTRVWEVLKSNSKSKPTLELLGCTIEFLKKHLESNFEVGMSFENYGKWHIDHIRPCASFDLSKPSEQHKCFNYTNLQPLWAKDNFSKADKWENNNE